MSYVLAILRVRKIPSKCLALLGVLLVFAALFVGVTDTCQNGCDPTDGDTPCSCGCHSTVATLPDTAVARSTEYADHLSGVAYSHIVRIVADIFRPPIA